MSVREEALKGHKTLLNGSGKLSYFKERGIAEETIRGAYVGYVDGAFTYPSIAKSGGLLGIHHKSETRNAQGKRKQWWEGYADDLPKKENGALAKVIPFGLETVKELEPGSLVVLCCGEEDALSLRQIGFTSLSQPGAGLLEPAYARELVGFEVVVFYDAGEEAEAHKDGLKLLEAGAASVQIVGWPQDAAHGTDINSRLVEDPEGFKRWVAGMVEGARLVAVDVETTPRKGQPEAYTDQAEPMPSSWPVLAEEALHGLSGDIVGAIEPHTEADPVAVLANQHAAFGNAVGRGAYVKVGADRHHLNLDILLVGETAKGRKGMSWRPVFELMHAADSEWADQRVLGGLSSGEGLIHAVRDQVVDRDKDGGLVVVDEGVLDKRLLALEGEFASALKMMCRQGNTLSAIVRQAWDGVRLQVLTRNNPIKATDAHISIIGHITKEELLRHLTETETANGFANRFGYLMVKRSKILPFGGEWQDVDTAPMVKRLREALEFGKEAGEITWGESAKDLWREVYEPLSEGKPGLFGAVVGRAEAQVTRLAAIYAVMDKSCTIELAHLEAALALWEYAESSARYIFGGMIGDPVADRIVGALRAAPKGLARNEIRNLFSRHRSSERLGQSLEALEKLGRIRRASESTSGRPAERWFLK